MAATSDSTLSRRPLAAAAAFVLAVGLLLAGCGSDDESSTATTTEAEAAATDAAGSTDTTAAASGEVVKDVLGQVDDPPGADGSLLTLIRYTIPAGAKLAPHIHPGVQLARIESGTLTYTVEEGTATVRRKGAETDEAVTGPTTITLDAGDTVTELDGMVHFGANDTDEPIVIIATLLTTDGEDLAVPVDDATS
jgi:quercetin dioxygenase-like cupin family protein